MAKLLTLSITLLSASFCYSQLYNTSKSCGTDTIYVDYRDLKYGEQIKYKAFQCTQVVKGGVRFDMGYSSFSYNPGTKAWLGNHSGFQLGFVFVHRKLNFGVRFKMATIKPKSELVFHGDTVKYDAKINPTKIDYYIGYSLDLKNNFSIEPYLGITRNFFRVINEKELNRSYAIPDVHGLNTGVTLNKYFKLKDFKFLSLFITYGYGFSNFKKVHSSLGTGYSEWTLGAAYKVFAKESFHKRL